MRNPYGKESYSGAWSDDDDKWTKQFKSQIIQGQHGVFYMPHDTFDKAFTNYDICMYEDYVTKSATH